MKTNLVRRLVANLCRSARVKESQYQPCYVATGKSFEQQVKQLCDLGVAVYQVRQVFADDPIADLDKWFVSVEAGSTVDHQLTVEIPLALTERSAWELAARFILN